MRRTLVLVVFGLAGVGGVAADDPKPTAPARLAELEKEIAAKEKDLTALRAEADALRKRIAAGDAPKDKVYRTPQELFADMPKDAYPKFGPAAGIERGAALKW